MRKNILFSTTRQWNVGDEFILLGLINVIKQADIFQEGFNCLIYNRNPDVIFQSRIVNPLLKKEVAIKYDSLQFRGKAFLDSLIRIGQKENSFKNGMDPNTIDIVCVAGSPEWYGHRLDVLYEYVLKHNIPCYIMAIGLGEAIKSNSISKDCYRVLKSCKLLTVRDEKALQFLTQFHPKYLPCTALLSSKSEKNISKVKKVALIFSTYKTLKTTSVNEETYKFMIELYKHVRRKWNCSFVCHYVDEVEEVRKEFPADEVYYDYDAKSYFDIYSNFDFVIGARVHGLGICASMGIPGVYIAHDARWYTVKGFLSEVVNYKKQTMNEILEIIEKNILMAEQLSLKLKEHKEKTMNKYIYLLKQSKET